MIKVLHVLNNLGSGGAESFVMNVYRNIDHSKVQFDFLIRSNQNGPLLDEIKQLGGKVYILPPFPKRIVANYIELKKFLREHAKEYYAIHVHANSLIYTKPLQYARKFGIPRRIIHSHSTHSAFELLHRINKKIIDKWVTDRIACSDMAGQWMFLNREYRIIPNGIQLNQFCFNENERILLRNQYGISDCTVIGNVGRFSIAKNHTRMISIFEMYHRNNPKSVLMLVGDGEERQTIKKLVDEKGLADSIIFTGAVTNVETFLSAMDVFLFPSFWEGLPIALIEAQVNQLFCLISDKVPIMVNCGGCHVASLDESDEVWVDKLTHLITKGRCHTISAKQYDICTVAKDLEHFYLSNCC